ncbi:terminase TerL endonuclease subunit [Pseudomonas sp. TMW22080]|uniref:terminase large subunit n=1 Tax=Pseudomonas sp. TMW22080 TaxID=2506432 RepID=UPI001F0EB88B|nr:terminase TerL endonuclease subunit [Pseudomonas sp. TMW22080]MCH4885527.1 terminase large subunit [Pseudomonas sp. TMW22080]
MAAPKYPLVKAAETYARRVAAGKIPCCKWIKLACKRHLDDLKASKAADYPYKFDPAKAEKIAKFLQLLPHTKGKWASKRELIKLEGWQLFSVCIPFGWLRKKDNTRRFRTIVIFVPRKNGKSIIGGGVGAYMFVADGEFGAEVYSGATTEKQAWEVFRPAKLMIERTPELRDHYGVEVNASNMCRLEDGSRFEPVIGKPGDGSSPSCAIVDEYHEHQDSTLFDTMETGMGAREQPVILVITTAGSSIGGPCHQLVRDAERMLEGVIDRPDLWAMLYTIDPGDDWTSEEALIKANPNHGISINGDFLLARQRDAMQSASKQATFRTKHLNEWVGAKNAWLNMLRWKEAPPRKSLQELEGRRCIIGLDLASKIDIAGNILLFPPVDGDPFWHVHGRYYLPEARVIEELDGNTSRYREFDALGLLTLTDGEVIDFEVIKDDLREFAGRFDIEAVAYDPWQATQLAQEMVAEGLPMVEIRQTVQNISEPMKELEALTLRRLLAHGDCPILTWMASNVLAKLDVKDNIYPNKERPENKIDGIVALIMSLSRAIANAEAQGSVDDFLSRPMSM